MNLLVLRPAIGGEATAERARARGHVCTVAPLFQYRPLPWTPPSVPPQAILMTSAAAARLGGDGLAFYRNLPLYAVGLATATAAKAAGFEDVTTGRSDVRAVLDNLADQGIDNVLHLAGRDRIEVTDTPIRIDRIPVYAANAVDILPEPALSALDQNAIVLLHSPRAARLFAALLADAGRNRQDLRIACFSTAVADAAGTGWAGVAIATQPTDDALFAAAAMLCDQDMTKCGSRDDDRVG